MQPSLLHEGNLLRCLLSGLHRQQDKPVQILNANEITTAKRQICEGEDASLALASLDVSAAKGGE